MAYLLDNGRPVLAAPISSGRYGHLTHTGSFKVLEKERAHYSSMYGKIVDAHGNTVVADADADGADGMHAGYLPGYPASHGCVRMPEQLAIAFFNSVSVGTSVTVFGRTPAGHYLGQSQSPFMRGGNRFADPRFGPRFDPRFGPLSGILPHEQDPLETADATVRAVVKAASNDSRWPSSARSKNQQDQRGCLVPRPAPDR